MTAAAPTPERRDRPLRIGEVVRRLSGEFPDISISKIRYLEDEGLVTPRRTQGGYRLFSEDDLARLETVLRLQRDEFLPLRVIREELEAVGPKERKRRKPAALGIRRTTPTLPQPARGCSASVSRRATCARSERPPGVRPRCSTSCSRRRCVHGAWSGVRRGCASCSSWPSW